jgi:hypothetical protein
VLLQIGDETVFKKASVASVQKSTRGHVDEECVLVIRRHLTSSDERLIISIPMDVVDSAEVKGSCLVLRKRHRDIFGKSWTMRWVVIRGDQVGVFKQQSSTEAKYWLYLPSCEVIEEEIVNKRFKVLGPHLSAPALSCSTRIRDSISPCATSLETAEM